MRDSFSRAFRKKGTIHPLTYLRTYHIGDYVDIRVNDAIHKVELFGALRGRLYNSNKNLIMATLSTISGIASTMGSLHFKSYCCAMLGIQSQRNTIICVIQNINRLAT